MLMLSCFISEFIYLLRNAISKGSIKTIENNEREGKLWLLEAHMTYFYTGSELIELESTMNSKSKNIK